MLTRIGVALLLLASCGDDGAAVSEARADLGWAPQAPGPFAVGHRTLEIRYRPPTVVGDRALTVSLWYPSSDSSGAPATYLGLVPDPDAFSDAGLAAPVGERYPVHVYSHGHRGFAGATAPLMRHFASHGWVVAAPDHAGNTLLDDPDRDNAIYFLRGHDISAVLDALATLPPSDPLAGLLDTDKVVASGHSFGGYTVFGLGGAAFDMAAIAAGCDTGAGPGGDPCTQGELDAFAAGTTDTRVAAIVPMAAGDYNRFGPAGYAQVSAEVLLMTGDDDTNVPNASEGDLIWAALSATDAIRVDIAGGCHQTFGVGNCPLIDDQAGYKIVLTYALAMARHHILDDAAMSTILDGTTSVAPQARPSTR